MTVQTDDVTAVEGSGGLYSRAVPREVNGNINDSFHGLVPSITSCFSEKIFNNTFSQKKIQELKLYWELIK